MVGKHATKPFVLRLSITLKNTSALVVHRPTRKAVASASSLERDLKPSFSKSSASVEVAARIGEILAQRLTLKDVHAVHLNLDKERAKHDQNCKQLTRFHALIDGLLRNGVEILP